MFSATTIQDVLDQLETIINNERAVRSPLGFFAALYHQVTTQVQHGIARGFFDDGARMEQLDVVFANFYLNAYHAWRHHRPVAQSWRQAFKHEKDDDQIILQHVLLGINAHINLDLGHAAATIAPGAQLETLKQDFDKIHAILADLLDPVENVIGCFSPLIGILDQIGGKNDEALAGFSIGLARASAWSQAQLLAKVDPAHRAALVTHFDEKAAFLGKTIAQPGHLLTIGFRLIRSVESRDVVAVIDALRTVSPAADA